MQRSGPKYARGTRPDSREPLLSASTFSTVARGTHCAFAFPFAPFRQPGVAALFQPLPPSAHGPIRYPMIPAVAHSAIFFGMAFGSTSLTFIIRSISAAEYCWGFVHYPPSPAPSRADRSRVNWTGQLTY